MASGNHKSTNKQKKQRVTPGNYDFKTILCEIAWVIASHKKLCLSAWYWRLKQRTDAKRAIVALARKLLVIIFAMLRSNCAYDEQRFFQHKQTKEQKCVSRMVHELTKLRYTISVPA
jgi:transposase